MAKDMFREGVEMLCSCVREMRHQHPADAVEYLPAVVLGGALCVTGAGVKLVGTIAKPVHWFLADSALNIDQKLKKPFDHQKRW